MDNPLYDHDLDAFPFIQSGHVREAPFPPAPGSKDKAIGKGKFLLLPQLGAFARWVLALSLLEVIGVGLALGTILTASAIVALHPSRDRIASLAGFLLMVPVAWRVRGCFRWSWARPRIVGVLGMLAASSRKVVALVRKLDAVRARARAAIEANPRRVQITLTTAAVAALAGGGVWFFQALSTLAKEHAGELRRAQALDQKARVYADHRKHAAMYAKFEANALEELARQEEAIARLGQEGGTDFAAKNTLWEAERARDRATKRAESAASWRQKSEEAARRAFTE